jgi:flavin-dependent dehydrogenase
MDDIHYQGPLRDGARVVIIGGGPGGCSVALTLLRIAEQRKKHFDITLYEHKKFGYHFNQCIGVLSPPITDILANEFGIDLPPELVQRRIKGYVLHGAGESIELQEDGGDAIAVRRVELDAYLLSKVKEKGIKIIESRVTALEMQSDGVCIFSESGQTKADIAFGCFGLDPGLSKNLSRYTFYHEPKVIDTLITRYDCPPELMERFEDKVQAFLPPIEGVEFAALTPKSKHVSVVISGHRLRTDCLDLFFNLKSVKQYLPKNFKHQRVFKGQFPCSPAKGFYEDRFVTVGDAAGLIRPFKGKGINSAIITGALAANVATTIGISKRAFTHYKRDCNFIIRDFPYGQFVRLMTNFISHQLSLGPIIRLAKKNKHFRWAIAMAVTGGATYRAILAKCLRPSVLFGMIASFISWPFRRRKNREDD